MRCGTAILGLTLVLILAGPGTTRAQQATGNLILTDLTKNANDGHTLRCHCWDGTDWTFYIDPPHTYQQGWIELFDQNNKIIANRDSGKTRFPYKFQYGSYYVYDGLNCTTYAADGTAGPVVQPWSARVWKPDFPGDGWLRSGVGGNPTTGHLSLIGR